MKIGILTFHRAHNYGAVLQCYALQEALRMFGYDVSVIDYRQPALEIAYKKWNFITILRNFVHPKMMLDYVHYFLKRNNEIKLFSKFSKYLNLTEACDRANIPTYFDAYIIGSDQVWVPRWTGGKMDDVYAGFFKHNKTSFIFSYAISLNQNSIAQVPIDKWKSIVENFEVLSFRESKIALKISQLTQSAVRVDLDPTLLLNKEKWDSITNNKWEGKRYLLIYHLPGRYGGMTENSFNDKALQIAKSMNCEVISLFPMRFAVNDFVSLFKYAQGIITTSFHATVFSLIYEKPLMSVVLNDGYDNRYVELLDAIGASAALVDKNFNNGIFPKIDYKKVSMQRKKLAYPSLDYLKNIKHLYKQ